MKEIQRVYSKHNPTIFRAFSAAALHPVNDPPRFAHRAPARITNLNCMVVLNPSMISMFADGSIAFAWSAESMVPDILLEIRITRISLPSE